MLASLHFQRHRSKRLVTPRRTGGGAAANDMDRRLDHGDTKAVTRRREVRAGVPFRVCRIVPVDLWKGGATLAADHKERRPNAHCGGGGGGGGVRCGEKWSDVRCDGVGNG